MHELYANPDRRKGTAFRSFGRVSTGIRTELTIAQGRIRAVAIFG